MPSTTDIEPAPTSVPAAPSGADEYRRLILHARTTDAAVAITVAHHTGRRIVDGAVTIARPGRQDTVSVSARYHCAGAPFPPGRLELVEPDPLDGPFLPLVAGSLRVDPVEGTDGMRLVVDDADATGIAADLTWHPLADPFDLPEDPCALDAEVRILPVSRRLHRVRCMGAAIVDGQAVDLGQAVAWIETSGGYHPPAPSSMAPALSEPFRHRLRLVLLTSDGLVHVVADEQSRGRYRYDAAGESDDWTLAGWRSSWRRGTRWPSELGVGLRRGGRRTAGPLVVVDVDLTSGLPLAARALGSADPLWPEGLWHDEVAVGRSSWNPDELDPADVHHLHRFTWATAAFGGESVPALVETLAVGPSLPSDPSTPGSFTGFTDGYAG